MQATVDDFSSAAMTQPISLWSPRVLAICTVLLNVPAGLTLATINWRRMGQDGKSPAAALGAVFAACVIIALHGQATQVVYLAGIGAGVALRKQMEHDIATYAASEERVETAPWGVGVLIAIGVCVPLIVAVLAL